MVRDELTNEKFGFLFPDNFQLARFAIHIAQKEIQSGNDELNIPKLLEKMKSQPKSAFLPPEAGEQEELEEEKHETE